jgi:hypothetical protein
MSKAYEIPGLLKAAGGFLIIEDGSGQITLTGISLAEVVLKHRPENGIVAERKGFVVVVYGQSIHARSATDIPHPLDLVDIHKAARKLATDILIDLAMLRTFQQFGYQLRATSFDGSAVDF